jgi:hypothetical protein
MAVAVLVWLVVTAALVVEEAGVTALVVLEHQVKDLQVVLVAVLAEAREVEQLALVLQVQMDTGLVLELALIVLLLRQLILENITAEVITSAVVVGIVQTILLMEAVTEA